MVLANVCKGESGFLKKWIFPKNVTQHQLGPMFIGE
jgi:hypothetical protein